MTAYSFLDVQASIIGPGLNATIGSTPGSSQVGSSAGVAKEGITVEYDDPKSTVITAADGTIMTNLHATQTGKVTIRLIKTSPINAVLSQGYAAQRSSAANWAQNTITVTDVVSGDVAGGTNLAYEKFPSDTWAEDGNILEWVFIGIVNNNLGPGAATIPT